MESESPELDVHDEFRTDKTYPPNDRRNIFSKVVDRLGNFLKPHPEEVRLTPPYKTYPLDKEPQVYEKPSYETRPKR